MEEEHKNLSTMDNIRYKYKYMSASFPDSPNKLDKAGLGMGLQSTYYNVHVHTCIMHTYTITELNTQPYTSCTCKEYASQLHKLLSYAKSA